MRERGDGEGEEEESDSEGEGRGEEEGKGRDGRGGTGGRGVRRGQGERERGGEWRGRGGKVERGEGIGGVRRERDSYSPRTVREKLSLVVPSRLTAEHRYTVPLSLSSGSSMVYDNSSLVVEDATISSPRRMVMLVMTGLSPEVASHVTVRFSPTLTVTFVKLTVGPAGKIREGDGGGRERGRGEGRERWRERGRGIVDIMQQNIHVLTYDIDWYSDSDRVISLSVSDKTEIVTLQRVLREVRGIRVILDVSEGECGVVWSSDHCHRWCCVVCYDSSRLIGKSCPLNPSEFEGTIHVGSVSGSTG